MFAISTLDFGPAGPWANAGTGLVVSPRKVRRMRGWKEVGRWVGTRAIESKVQSLRSKVEDQMSAIMTLDFARGLWTNDGTGHVSARREGDDWTAVGRWGTGSPAGMKLDPRRWWGSVFTKGKEDPRQGQTRSWPGPDTRQVLAILSS